MQAPTASKRRQRDGAMAGEGKADDGAGICARMESSRRGRSCYVQKVSLLYSLEDDCMRVAGASVAVWEVSTRPVVEASRFH